MYFSSTLCSGNGAGPYPSTSVGEVCLASVVCIDDTIAGKISAT